MSWITLIFLHRKVPAELICLPPFAQGSDNNPSGMSRLPVLSLPPPIPAYCLVTSILYPAFLLLLTGRDSPFFPVKYRRLAGWVWWLLAVVCTRCINKVGKKTYFLILSALWHQEGQPFEKKIQTLKQIPLFSLVSSFFAFPQWSPHSLFSFKLHK